MPLQLLADAVSLVPTGTPAVHFGVAGGLFHSTPWGTSLGLVKVTAPPTLTVAVGGFQRYPP